MNKNLKYTDNCFSIPRSKAQLKTVETNLKSNFVRLCHKEVNTENEPEIREENKSVHHHVFISQEISQMQNKRKNKTRNSLPPMSKKV